MKESLGQQSYRTWFERDLIDLPLYWQPRWLDIVSPNWEACCENDDWSNPKWVWPYNYSKKGIYKVIQLPACTPYLGPILLDVRSSPPLLPKGVSYGLYTFRQPVLCFTYKEKARAMSTSILDLSQKLTYSKSLKQRLNYGRKRLKPILIDDLYYSALESLVIAKSELNPKNVNAIMRSAQLLGVGELWGILNENNELEAAAGILYDNKNAFLPFSVRKSNPDPNANPLLYHTVISRAQELGKNTFDFTGGYLPGPRQFFESFGAVASWYGQVREANGFLFQTLETIRKKTNSKRI